MRHRRNYREGNIFHGNIEGKTHNGEYIYIMGIPRGGHKVGNIHNGDSEGKKKRDTQIGKETQKRKPQEVRDRETKGYKQKKRCSGEKDRVREAEQIRQ
jgi:hypothetical protein